MNLRHLQRHLTRGIAVLLLFGCATAMLAADPLHPRGIVGNGKPRSEAPLLFLIPADTPGNETIELRVMQGDRLLVRETIALPETIAKRATLDVLVTHAAVLKELRAREAKTAGSLRITLAIGSRTIAEESFGAVDKRSPSLSTKSAVGEAREVEVRLNAKAPRKIGALVIDPECEDACYQQYLACYERCDERGDSCAICSREWNDCLYSCPQQCTEPKSVTYYYVYVPIGAQHFNIFSCASPFAPTTWGELWEEVYAYYTIYYYQRTQHCDDTYTDLLINSYPAEGWCWYDTYQQCSPANDQPPTNICP